MDELLEMYLKHQTSYVNLCWLLDIHDNYNLALYFAVLEHHTRNTIEYLLLKNADPAWNHPDLKKSALQVAADQRNLPLTPNYSP